MQTTIEIEEEVLQEARSLAFENHQSLEEYLSTVTRAAIQAHSVIGGFENGMPYLRRTPRSREVTPEMVEKIREESGE